MDLIEYTNTWAKGDAFQGRVMLVVGTLVLIACWMIFRSNSELLKGALIPLSFVVLAFLGYGGFLAFTRQAHTQSVQELLKNDPQKAIDQEFEKAERDHKTYSRLKPIWAILIVVSLVLFFVLKTPHQKGLCLGLITMFFLVLVLDTTLHNRLKPYYAELSKLKGQE